MALAAEVDVQLSMPRLARRRRNRENHGADGPQIPEEYYRRTMGVPILELITENMKTRFQAQKGRYVADPAVFVPLIRANPRAGSGEMYLEEWTAVVVKFAEKYKEDFGRNNALMGSFHRWTWLMS